MQNSRSRQSLHSLYRAAIRLISLSLLSTSLLSPLPALEAAKLRNRPLQSIKDSDYPKILNPEDDPVYRQYRLEVETSRKRSLNRDPPLPMAFFLYRVQPAQNLFQIAGQTGISFESIATLNRLELAEDLPSPGSYILLPNRSGIFLPEQNPTPWEEALKTERNHLLFLKVQRGRDPFHYYPESSFTKKEKSLFRRNLFQNPVITPFFITSPFGFRKDPIHKRRSFHDGIDIRSPFAKPVLSIADGTVTEIGTNQLHGLYVKIQLKNGLTALYGHLTAVLAKMGQSVPAGLEIGSSGDSGRITGPHLHLSLFQGGKPIDPTPYFEGKR